MYPTKGTRLFTNPIASWNWGGIIASGILFNSHCRAAVIILNKILAPKFVQKMKYDHTLHVLLLPAACYSTHQELVVEDN